MTVAVQALPITYNGNGTASPLAVPFRFLSNDHLIVTRIDANGARTVLVRGTDYSVSGAGAGSGGTVTPLASIAVGVQWEINRATPREQPTAYPTGDDFPAATHELALDRNMLVAQEIDARAADMAARAPLALPGQVAPAFDVTDLAEGDLLEYSGGRLRRFNAAPFAAKFYGGAAVTGRPVPLSGTGGADGALRADLADDDGDQLIKTVDGDNLRKTLLNRVSVRSLIAAEAFGDAGTAANVWTGEVDNAALAALINDVRNNYTRLYSERGNQDDFSKRATTTYALNIERRFFILGPGDMPALPPGCEILSRGATIIMGEHNQRILWTDGGSQAFPTPGADGPIPSDEGGLTAYGSDNLWLELPEIIGNGFAGSPVRLITVARSTIKDGKFLGIRGSSYTLSGAVVEGSRFIGVTPADYAKVKPYDVIDCGVIDSAGNPQQFLVKDKRVLNAGASDRTYGKLKLHKAVARASGNYSITQMSVPVVTAGFQQCEMNNMLFAECDWTVHLGDSADEIISDDNTANGAGYGSDANWLTEVQSARNPSTDMRINHFQSEHCKYGGYHGGLTSMVYMSVASLQFNSHGSEFIFDGIGATLHMPRVEIRNDASEALKAIPAIAIIGGCTLTITGGLEWVANGTGRYLIGQFDDATLRFDQIKSAIPAPVPQMPDGSYALILRPGSSGRVEAGTVSGMTGPTVGGLPYQRNPFAWITDGEGTEFTGGYSAFAPQAQGGFVGTGNGLLLHPGFDEPIFALQEIGDPHPWFVLKGNKKILIGDGSSAPTAGFDSNFGNIYYTATGGGKHRLNGVGVVTPALPTYADEAEATSGGLEQHALYKTAAGEIRIKL